LKEKGGLKMKVILTQTVKGHGVEGDVIEVSRGYADCYLVPQHFAVPVTPDSIRQLEARRDALMKLDNEKAEEAESIRRVLDGKTVTILVPTVGDNNRLFGSVTCPVIIDAIKATYGIEIDRHDIDTGGIIKSVGKHSIKIDLYRDIRAFMTVDVVSCQCQYN